MPCTTAQGDDKSGIFPPLPSAQSVDHWQDGYFWLNGRPTFINSGSIHYARVPRELWRDRIWRLKMMGFNCAQSYVFWNATEPKEGVFNFTDNLDLDAWLTTLQQMGMYALVRVGPYSCAEWEEGGYPSWLTDKPGMVDREMGPSLPYSDALLSKVEGITARHQISRGGNVFLVQIENEHSNGWGTDVTDPYLKYLDDQARANGIEIPMFNSGLHHSHDPAGEKPVTPGPSPWYSTEFWTVYSGHYGDMTAATLAQKTAASWKISAFGGAGYNYYMAHGGTNFGYSGWSHAATYDYSAPIGEAGQLRPFYFQARRAAYFDQTFTRLLTGSHNDPAFAAADNPQVRVTTRTNPTGGSYVLVDDFQKVNFRATVLTDTKVETHITAGGLRLPHQGSLVVDALVPRTVLVHLPWTANATFESLCTNILFRQTLGGTDYWVCYGPAGETGEVTLTRKAPSAAPSQFDFTYPPGDTVTEIPIDSGDGRQAKLLVMNTERTDRTWLAHDTIYVGPTFVREDGRLEFPPEGGEATLYSAAGKSELVQPAAALPPLPALTHWAWRDAAPERAAGLSAAGWSTSQGPQPMSSCDDFQNRYGWYRVNFHRDAAGPVSLHFSGMSGTFVAYLNGQPSSLDDLDARAGDNALVILAKADPRSTNTYDRGGGPVDMRLARGLWGGVSTEKAATPLAVTWKEWSKAPSTASAADLAKPGYDDSAWLTLAPAATSSMTVSRGTTWFRGTFTVAPGQTDSTIEAGEFESADNVYLNGKRLDARDNNLAVPTTLSQDASSLLVPGKNTLLLQVQSRLGDMGALGVSLRHNSPLTHAVWHFHGGLADLDETAIIGRVTDWSDFLAHAPWHDGAPSAPGQPAFWRSTFTYHPTIGFKETIGLMTDGLKAGNVWLNGHNLGECPQKVPMYMPECWLRDGANDLVIFDLYGASPAQSQLSRYEAFAVAAPKS